MIFFNRKKYLFLNYLSKNKDINYKNHFFFLSHYFLSRCPAGDSVAGCTCSLISLQCEVVKSLGATRGPATAAGARRAPLACLHVGVGGASQRGPWPKDTGASEGVAGPGVALVPRLGCSSAPPRLSALPAPVRPAAARLADSPPQRPLSLVPLLGLGARGPGQGGLSQEL